MKVKWSGIAVTDGRGKIGGTVLSKSRAGATARNKVTPINRRSAAQSAVRATFGSFSQLWRTLTTAQRNAWNALATSGVSYTNIFGDVVRLAGNALYIASNINLSIASVAAISNAPDLSDSAAGLTGVEPLSDVSSSNLFPKTAFIGGGNTVPADNVLVVLVTPKLSPGVSFVRSQLRILTVLDAAVDTSTENIWAPYTARFGAPAVGDNIVIQVVTINKLSGFAGVGVKSAVSISA